MQTLEELTAWKRRLEKRDDATNMIRLLAKFRGDVYKATAEAETLFRHTDIARHLKSAVEIGDTTSAGWAAELNYATFTSELVQLQNANSLLNLPWRRVDFNTRSLRETVAPGSVGWVAEGEPIPVSRMTLATLNVERTRISGLVAFTNEVIQLWTPATAAAIRSAVTTAAARYIDFALLNPNLGAIAGTRPASLTSGLVPIPSPAFTEAGVTAAVRAAVQGRIDGGSDGRNLVMVTSPGTALSYSTLLTSGGHRAYPDVGIRGGTMLGLPVATTPGAAASGSPTENLTVILDPTRCVLADDGAVGFDASDKTAVEMSDVPSGPAALVTAFQTQTTFIRFRRYLNFERADAHAVGYFTTTY